MRKNIFLIFMTAAFALISACGSSDTNTNSNMNTNQANLPPGFSTSPVPLSDNSTPGIPANPGNMNMINPNGTPTPGIPHPANIGKIPKGTTPTPGIPSEAELKKQMKSVPLNDVNSNPTKSNTKVKTVRKP